MELKEAINIINNFRTWYMGGDISNDVLQEIYKAIDTVLEELNNRIPRKYIENILENLNEGQYILNKNGEISGKRYEYMAIDYLQKLLNKE